MRVLDEDITLELIPIEAIEKVIKDGDTFVAFVKSSDTFDGIPKSSYVEAINAYMDYAFYHSTSLSADDFNRANYINTIYEIDKRYDYEEYMRTVKPQITYELLYSIIRDGDVFARFMDYDNNKDFFGDVDLVTYYSQLMEFINRYTEQGNMELTFEEKDRLRDIKRKYSLLLKSDIHLTGYQVNNSNVDDELFQKVIEDIDTTRDAFYVARAVYIKLAQVVTYDPTFIALEQDIENDEQAWSIYHKNIEDINLQNNRVVCKSWAELYSKILNMLGINAVVTGEKAHKYVLVDCDGALIKADATNEVTSPYDSLTIPDIARIQMGLPTGGFTCPELDKDISAKLDEVDEEILYRSVLADKRISDLEAKYMAIKKREASYEERFFDVVEFLRNIAESFSSNGLELSRYVHAIGKPLFKKNKIYGAQIRILCKKVDDIDYDAATLIAFVENDYYKYIVLAKGYYEELTGDELLRRLREGSFVVAGKNKSVLGIGENYGFAK